MRIAETVGSRTLLVISSLGLAAAIAAWVAQPDPVVRAREPVRPMRSCMKARPRAAPPVVKPAPVVVRTHSEQVHALRQDLTRCIDGGVEATLTIWTRPDGSVRDFRAEGRLGARPEAFVSCMNAVVKPVQFPTSETELRVEMLLTKD